MLAACIELDKPRGEEVATQTFADIEDVTGFVNDRVLPETLATRDVFDRLIAVLEAATAAKRHWEAVAGTLSPEEQAYEQGASDGIGCVYFAVQAIQDLALNRPTMTDLVGFKFRS